MAAIAGVASSGMEEVVNQMLSRMAHRGSENLIVKTFDNITLGVCWPPSQAGADALLSTKGIAEDFVSETHYARAQVDQGNLILTRDPLGISPLYYGYTAENHLCFASEVKGLLGLVNKVHELAPGSQFQNGKVTSDYQLAPRPPLERARIEIAAELRRRLENSVKKRASRGVSYGAWLSGGLDSSIMAAIARSYSPTLHTFTVGFHGAPDLEYARMVARHIRANHHELIPTVKEVIKIIPEVIYYLESFDAFLVRSSLMNYLVAKMASDYVAAVFSGEGGDELFAGYDYLRKLPFDRLSDELIDITNRLHNTALQRVDRCAVAHGTIAYVGFLDQEVVDYALQIPVEYKIYNGKEKWILRRAVLDLLPERVTMREKAMFWEGAGVDEQIAAFAEKNITDADFRKESLLPNGELINSKEELYYYRIFQERFGSLQNLDWMGRTKGTPKVIVP
jgi:asparagine synthase (glutamine-hydrolysing)